MSKNSIIISAVLVILVVVIGVAVGTSMSKKEDTAKKDNNSKMEEKTVMVGGAAMYPSKNIVENISNANNLTSLVAAVKAADLVTTLQGAGPFTVFGPTNAAFNELPAGTVETLLKPENKATLQAILKYHVVSGKYLVADLKDGQVLTTLQGQTLKVTKSGEKTMVGSATIETKDVIQSNGVAHVINKVLQPDLNPTVGGAAMSRDKNLVENASMAPNLTTVVAALKAASLVEALQGAGPFTVFAPDNTAFTKLPAGTVETLLKPENKATLQSVLTYHVVAGKYLVADLTDGQVLTTLNGQKLTVIKKDGKVSLQTTTTGNIAALSTADVVQSNGIAHIIDTVLLPKS
jgi:transforming growth factor-beta-induced protein